MNIIIQEQDLNDVFDDLYDILASKYGDEAGEMIQNAKEKLLESVRYP